MRIGQGIDFHRYKEDGPIYLAGLELPETFGLLGHSDADVILHACMDAILGALSLGDIGEHFPDTDMMYKGIRSTILTQRVLSLMKEQGYHIVNLDITLVGNKPRVSKYKAELLKSLRQLFGTDFVALKATTSEGLGDIGKGEGLAASAVVLLEHGTL